MDSDRPGHEQDSMSLDLSQRPAPLMNEPIGVHGLSLRAIYDSHFAFVWRNLRRLGVAPTAVEDAAQDVFLVVHRRLDSFDPDRCKLETWLFGILLRVAKNHHRAARRAARKYWFWQVAQADGSERGAERVSPEQGPDEHVASRQAAKILDDLLERMDESVRAIFVLVDIEGLSVVEAAQAVQCNLNTAHWRLRTARLFFDRSLARMRRNEVLMEGRA